MRSLSSCDVADIVGRKRHGARGHHNGEEQTHALPPRDPLKAEERMKALVPHRLTDPRRCSPRTERSMHPDER